MSLPTTKGGHILAAIFSGTSSMPLINNYRTGVAPLITPPSVEIPAGIVWNIDGNDKWGDCTIGCAANAIPYWNAVIAKLDNSTTGLGANDAVPTSAQAVSQYQVFSGSKTPGDSKDTGLVIANVLQSWMNPGLFGDNKINGAAPVKKTVAEVKTAIANYGLIYTGVNLPQSAEDQVNSAPAGTMPVWSYIGDAPVGGHCIGFIGYNGNLYAYTWGMVVAVEPTWFDAYVEEVWAIISQSYVQAGKGPEVDLAALQADLSGLNPKPPKKKHWWSSIL